MFVQLLIPVLILLAFAYVMTIFWANQKRWFTVLWIPGVACLGRPTLYLLKLLTIHGSGPDSGFVGMGIGFALIGGLPIIILFILTVIAYPRGPTWDIKFAIVGLILTIAIFMVWSFATTEAVAIQVLQPDGLPSAGCLLILSTHDLTRDQSVDRRTAVTDSNGYIRCRIEVWSSTSVGFSGSEKYLPCSTYITPAGGDQTISISYQWISNIDPFLGIRRTETRSTHDVISLMLRPSETVIAPVFQQQIRNELILARDKGTWCETSLCNFESLNYIEMFPEIIRMQPQLRQQVLQAMEMQAKLLRTVTAIVKDQYPAEEKYSILCRWASVDPTDRLQRVANLDAIRAKVRSYANQLIDVSKPFWTDDNGTADVLLELGPLARPAMPFLPDAIQRAAPRARQALENVLIYLSPKSSPTRS